jgi:sporulation protein YlmC with PRC-barrel domain
MRFGKDLTGKPIYSIVDGRYVGGVKDLYVNKDLYWMTGIHVGHEGFLKRKSLIIQRDNVVVFGIDAILVNDANVVKEEKDVPDLEKWLRLDKLRGREVDTPGGTRVGTISDIVIGEEGHITDFVLGKVFVEGPIADKGLIPHDALIDTGNDDKVMTIDLPKVEKLYQQEEGTSEEAE